MSTKSLKQHGIKLQVDKTSASRSLTAVTANPGAIVAMHMQSPQMATSHPLSHHTMQSLDIFRQLSQSRNSPLNNISPCFTTCSYMAVLF